MPTHEQKVRTIYPDATCFRFFHANQEKFAIRSSPDPDFDGIWLSGSSSFNDEQSAWVRACSLLNLNILYKMQIKPVDAKNLPDCQVFVLDNTIPGNATCKGTLLEAADGTISCVGPFGYEVKNVTHFIYEADLVNFLTASAIL